MVIHGLKCLHWGHCLSFTVHVVLKGLESLLHLNGTPQAEEAGWEASLGGTGEKHAPPVEPHFASSPLPGFRLGTSPCRGKGGDHSDTPVFGTFCVLNWFRPCCPVLPLVTSSALLQLTACRTGEALGSAGLPLSSPQVKEAQPAPKCLFDCVCICGDM